MYDWKKTLYFTFKKSIFPDKLHQKIKKNALTFTVEIVNALKLTIGGGQCIDFPDNNKIPIRTQGENSKPRYSV